MARLIASDFDRSVAVEADWFSTTIVNGGIPPWDIDADAQNQAVLRASLATAARMANAGYSTILEGIIGPWYLDLIREELVST